MNAISQRELARRLGCSVAAVSMALNNHPRIGDDMRRRVRLMAEELGYQRDPLMGVIMSRRRMGKSARGMTSLTLVTFLGEELRRGREGPRRQAKGVREEAARLGFGFETIPWKQTATDLAPLCRRLRNLNTAGVILQGFHERPGRLGRLVSEYPCCVLGQLSEPLELPVAALDFFHSVQLTWRECARLGYRRPGLVLMEGASPTMNERYLCGWRSLQDESGRRLPPPLVVPVSAAGEKIFCEWLRRHAPDVVVCSIHAVEEWLRRARVQVPEEIGLAHLNLESEWTGWAGLQQPTEEIGRAAAALVVEEHGLGLRGLPATPKIVLFRAAWRDGATLPPR